MGLFGKIKDAVVEKQREVEYNKQIKKDAKSEYLAEKYKTEKEYAKKRARLDAEAKLKAYKERLNRPKPSGGGFIQGFQGASQGALGALVGGSPPSQRPVVKRVYVKPRRKSKRKSKRKYKRKTVKAVNKPYNPYSMF